MQSCCPYLYFDGQADAAMNAYQKALGGELKLLRYSDAPAGGGEPPPGCGPVDKQRIMHGMLQFDGGMLMCSDAPNSGMAEKMGGMSVSVTFPDAAKARRVFDALADGAQQVRMPFAQTFWADGFGMLVDRFGTPWMIGGGQRAV
ncbi:glyoxalase/bleomycin resistance/extradiol dioxygenase family protein [Ramlibacter agri]